MYETIKVVYASCYATRDATREEVEEKLANGLIMKLHQEKAIKCEEQRTGKFSRMVVYMDVWDSKEGCFNRFKIESGEPAEYATNTDCDLAKMLLKAMAKAGYVHTEKMIINETGNMVARAMVMVRPLSSTREVQDGNCQDAPIPQVADRAAGRNGDDTRAGGPDADAAGEPAERDAEPDPIGERGDERSHAAQGAADMRGEAGGRAAEETDDRL